MNISIFHVSGGATYRFIECTVGQSMTRALQTGTRQVTLSDLDVLLEKYDFNAFPVVQAGKMLGVVTKLVVMTSYVFTTGQIVPDYDDLMKRTVADIMTESVVQQGEFDKQNARPLNRQSKIAIRSNRPYRPLICTIETFAISANEFQSINGGRNARCHPPTCLR